MALYNRPPDDFGVVKKAFEPHRQCLISLAKEIEGKVSSYDPSARVGMEMAMLYVASRAVHASTYMEPDEEREAILAYVKKETAHALMRIFDDQRHPPTPAVLKDAFDVLFARAAEAIRNGEHRRPK